MPEIAEKDLHLLFELGSLGRLKRNYALHPEAPSVAAHSHRVAFIALMLAKLEQADMHKTLYMALTHDIPETRTGDLTLFQEPYVQKDELKAVGDMFSESIFSEIIDIFKEYED
ncbi:MAG: HD domain-containing protein [Alphaproteobacteria bacterium]|nr:HD domain-containing protein [Alphaproteobacteria bacterium]